LKEDDDDDDDEDEDELLSTMVSPHSVTFIFGLRDTKTV
jgi:hypothetical protein